MARRMTKKAGVVGSGIFLTLSTTPSIPVLVIAKPFFCKSFDVGPLRLHRISLRGIFRLFRRNHKRFNLVAHNTVTPPASIENPQPDNKPMLVVVDSLLQPGKVNLIQRRG